MAVLMLSISESLLSQLRLSEAKLVGLSDDPVGVARLFHRQRQLDRLQLSLDQVEQSDSESYTLRKWERRLGAQQDKAIRRFLLSPVTRSATLVRLLVLIATIEPGLTASALRTIAFSIALPGDAK